MTRSLPDPVTRRETLSWQPTDADWLDGGPGHEAISKYGGRKYWVVYGKWDRLWDGDTKPYWSDAEWFEIVK